MDLRQIAKPAVKLAVGDVVAIRNRRVRVCGLRDGVTVCRDGRGRVAVRNVETNRLSYVPDTRLRKIEEPCDPPTRWQMSSTGLEPAEDGEWVRVVDIPALFPAPAQAAGGAIADAIESALRSAVQAQRAQDAAIAREAEKVVAEYSDYAASVVREIAEAIERADAEG